MSRHNRPTQKPKDFKRTLGRLFSYLQPYRVAILVSVVLTILATLAALYGSYAIKPILDLVDSRLRNEITLAQMNSSMIKELTILFFAYALEILFVYIAAKLMLQVSEKSMHKMREELFSHLMNAKIGYHDQQQHGELMSRFTNDIGVLSETLGDTTRTFIGNVLTITGTLILMIIISPLLTLVVLLILPLILLVIKTMGQKTRQASKERQISLGKLNGFIEESIEGVTVNQLMNREDLTLEEFDHYSGIFSKKSHTSQSLSTSMMPIMQNFNMILYAATGIVGGYLSIAGRLTVGSLGSFVNLTRTFGRLLNMISMQFATINSALSAAERIFEVLDVELEEVNKDDIALENMDGHVIFNNVDFSYVENNPVLKDVSFWAKPNQKIAIVGSTGAGKTTITNLVSRFYEINDGEILIDETPINQLNRYELRKHIAMVLQDTHLFTGTIMENIRYGNLEATDEECIEAAKLANAHQFIMNLEFGYETPIRGDGEGLSVGQRQLLNIARAAVNNPRILILDEATSSIDTRTEQDVEKGMDKLMEGRTTFVIAHRLSTVRNANAIVVLEDGQVIERGDHDDLVAQGGRYASLVQQQSGSQ